jgi:hypothetical protein
MQAIVFQIMISIGIIKLINPVNIGLAASSSSTNLHPDHFGRVSK